MSGKRLKWWKAALLLMATLTLWTFLVCFPNPYIFVRNVVRYIRFPVDPSIMDIIEDEVPDDPKEIEKFVLELVEYKWDWQNYGSPDYVATARQAVTKRSGDCEDRAIVLASVFEAKKMPYNLRASLVHYWIDYPGKRANKGENEKVAFFGKTDGKLRLKPPDMGQWRRYFQVGKKGFWDTMPGYRKAIMIAGWLASVFLVYILNRKRKVAVGDEE